MNIWKEMRIVQDIAQNKGFNSSQPNCLQSIEIFCIYQTTKLQLYDRDVTEVIIWIDEYCRDNASVHQAKNGYPVGLVMWLLTY